MTMPGSPSVFRSETEELMSLREANEKIKLELATTKAILKEKDEAMIKMMKKEGIAQRKFNEYTERLRDMYQRRDDSVELLFQLAVTQDLTTSELHRQYREALEKYKQFTPGHGKSVSSIERMTEIKGSEIERLEELHGKLIEDSLKHSIDNGTLNVDVYNKIKEQYSDLTQIDETKEQYNAHVLGSEEPTVSENNSDAASTTTSSKKRSDYYKNMRKKLVDTKSQVTQTDMVAMDDAKDLIYQLNHREIGVQTTYFDNDADLDFLKTKTNYSSSIKDIQKRYSNLSSNRNELKSDTAFMLHNAKVVDLINTSIDLILNPMDDKRSTESLKLIENVYNKVALVLSQVIRKYAQKRDILKRSKYLLKEFNTIRAELCAYASHTKVDILAMKESMEKQLQGALKEWIASWETHFDHIKTALGDRESKMDSREVSLNAFEQGLHDRKEGLDKRQQAIETRETNCKEQEKENQAEDLRLSQWDGSLTDKDTRLENEAKRLEEYESMLTTTQSKVNQEQELSRQLLRQQQDDRDVLDIQRQELDTSRRNYETFKLRLTKEKRTVSTMLIELQKAEKQYDVKILQSKELEAKLSREKKLIREEQRHYESFLKDYFAKRDELDGEKEDLRLSYQKMHNDFLQKQKETMASMPQEDIVEDDEASPLEMNESPVDRETISNYLKRGSLALTESKNASVQADPTCLDRMTQTASFDHYMDKVFVNKEVASFCEHVTRLMTMRQELFTSTEALQKQTKSSNTIKIKYKDKVIRLLKQNIENAKLQMDTATEHMDEASTHLIDALPNFKQLISMVKTLVMKGTTSSPSSSPTVAAQPLREVGEWVTNDGINYFKRAPALPDDDLSPVTPTPSSTLDDDPLAPSIVFEGSLKQFEKQLFKKHFSYKFSQNIFKVLKKMLGRHQGRVLKLRPSALTSSTPLEPLATQNDPPPLPPSPPPPPTMEPAVFQSRALAPVHYVHQHHPSSHSKSTKPNLPPLKNQKRFRSSSKRDPPHVRDRLYRSTLSNNAQYKMFRGSPSPVPNSGPESWVKHHHAHMDISRLDHGMHSWPSAAPPPSST